MEHTCGTLNPTRAAYCMGCGARLGAVEVSSPDVEKLWKLERLIKLRLKGILSEAEFRADRARLFGPAVDQMLAGHQ